LSWETTEEKLQQHFQKYGEITEVIVMRDRITEKPRGFGFISFKEESSATKATQDTHVLDGRTIDAKPSVPQGDQQRPRSKKIFVGGLAPDTTEDQFKEYFEKYGVVLEAQIMVDHTSMRSRGFGFITFEDESSVQKVFAAGSHHEIAGKRVEVKNATPKGSGPQGRGDVRGLLPGRGYPGGRGYGEMGFGMGPGYHIAPGYVPVGPYGNYMPYGAFPGMMMGGYGYPGFAAGYPTGFGSGYPQMGAQQQQRPGRITPSSSSSIRPPGGPPTAQQQQPGAPSGSSSSAQAAGAGSSSMQQQQAGRVPGGPQQQQQAGLGSSSAGGGALQFSST